MDRAFVFHCFNAYLCCHCFKEQLRGLACMLEHSAISGRHGIESILTDPYQGRCVSVQVCRPVLTCGASRPSAFATVSEVGSTGLAQIQTLKGHSPISSQAKQKLLNAGTVVVNIAQPFYCEVDIKSIVHYSQTRSLGIQFIMEFNI